MTSYGVSSDNRLSSDPTWTSYTYDAEGNLTKKSKGPSAETWTYGYNERDQIVWMEDRATDGGSLLFRADFTYDVFGNRIQQVESSLTTRFGVDGQDVWVDLDGTNAVVTRYVRPDGVDALAARETAAGVVTWYLTDHLGSVKALMSTAGLVIDRLSYDAFGGKSETVPAVGDRFKYAGYQFDTTAGLYYVQARWYDPATAKWTSEDPIRFAAKDYNIYRYVGNNATDATDPTGLVLFSTAYSAPRLQEFLAEHTGELNKDLMPLRAPVETTIIQLGQGQYQNLLVEEEKGDRHVYYRGLFHGKR
jgi:RHS repeat-associated protein